MRLRRDEQGHGDKETARLFSPAEPAPPFVDLVLSADVLVETLSQYSPMVQAEKMQEQLVRV